MSVTTTITIISVVLIVCAFAYAVIRLIVNRLGNSLGQNPNNPVFLVPGRSDQSSGSTNWEPFIIAPESHDHGPHDHDEATQRMLATHVEEHHGPHTHDNLATKQDFQHLLGRHDRLQEDVDGLRRLNANLRRELASLRRTIRIRVASQRPLELIGALIGTIVGIIAAAVWPVRLYSYPTLTNVFVDGPNVKVDHLLVQNNWVWWCIIGGGMLSGLVIGLFAKWLLGRNTTVVEVQQ